MSAPGCVSFRVLPHFLEEFANLGRTFTVQLTSSIKENPRLRAAAEELKKRGVKVGDAVSEALRTMEESEVARAVCVRPCYMLSDASLITFFVLFFSFSPPTLVDIQGDRGRLLDNRIHDRAHSQHRGIQNPRGDGRRRTR